MFGPIFVVVAFFICLFMSCFVAITGGQSKVTEFGLFAMAGVAIFVILATILKAYPILP